MVDHDVKDVIAATWLVDGRYVAVTAVGSQPARVGCAAPAAAVLPLPLVGTDSPELSPLHAHDHPTAVLQERSGYLAPACRELRDFRDETRCHQARDFTELAVDGWFPAGSHSGVEQALGRADGG
jgi:hypothetical protein